MFPLALPASATRFLHSGIQIYLHLPLHFARMRSVEMTIAISGTFEKSAYGLCASVTDLENAMPSPLEKGDRGAVDKDYPGIKENETNEKSVFLQCHLRKTLFSLVSTDIPYRDNPYPVPSEPPSPWGKAHAKKA